MFWKQVAMHAMAVKYGGKFVDTFLKGKHLMQVVSTQWLHNHETVSILV